MATLREVRRRIGGVKNTQKITRAMKMVAAAKLRRAQQNVVAARPYAAHMKELLQHLVSLPGADTHDLVRPREVKTVALVVVTSDRGLCGSFNAGLLKTTQNHITTRHGALLAAGKVKLFCVGKKGFDFFVRRSFPVAGQYLGVFSRLQFGEAQAIARTVIEGYLREDFDRVEIVYNEFKSIAQQRIVVEQLLPVPAESTPDAEGARRRSVEYIYEPSREEILAALIPRYINFQLWRVLLESSAAEEGARMAAMENATENAEEMISHLQLQYNKARQAAITKELLEVVAGAEALTQS